MLLKNTIFFKPFKNKPIDDKLLRSLNNNLMYFTIDYHKGRYEVNSDFLWNWIFSVKIESDLDFIQKFMADNQMKSSGSILCLYRKYAPRTYSVISEKKRKITINKYHVFIKPSHFEFKQTYMKLKS